uniref:Uncharacterized protein n=1 Tax=Romanomermis culicivorax TaxID=13658 RepID=A0A915HZX0_ROMCU
MIDDQSTVKSSMMTSEAVDRWTRVHLGECEKRLIRLDFLWPKLPSKQYLPQSKSQPPGPGCTTVTCDEGSTFADRVSQTASRVTNSVEGVRARGITADPEKVKAITQYEFRKTKK